MPAASAEDTPLWQFSLAVYAAEGVAAECLALQERCGLDVNLLLFAAYAAVVEGVSLDPDDIAAGEAVAAEWHDQIVRGLRAVRRALKPVSLAEQDPRRAAAAALRARVKNAELDAEKIEQAMLWRWSRERLRGRQRTSREAALTANLQALLAHFAPWAAQDTELPQLRAAALAFDNRKT